MQAGRIFARDRTEKKTSTTPRLASCSDAATMPHPDQSRDAPTEEMMRAVRAIVQMARDQVAGFSAVDAVDTLQIAREQLIALSETPGGVS
jgi:hypothetical protein